MDINLQFVQTKADPKAETLVHEKLSDLEKKFSWIIRADVFFKEEKDTYGKGKICEIRLSVPGARIHASSDEASFAAAVAETIRDLERQLRSKKDKWEPQN